MLKLQAQSMALPCTWCDPPTLFPVWFIYIFFEDFKRHASFIPKNVDWVPTGYQVLLQKMEEQLCTEI